MAEIAPIGSGGANRVFLIIVLGLAAVLVVGLIGFGALFLVPTLLRTSPAVATVTITPTRVVIAAATATLATPADTPTSVLIAQAPTNTPTSTLAATATSSPAPSSTPGTAATTTPALTPAVATATPTAGGALPSTGLGDDLLVLALGLVLVALIFAARHARRTG